MITSPWYQLTRRIAIRSTINRIYQAWTTQSGMEAWFLRQCIYYDKNGNPLPAEKSIREGSFSWMWHGHRDEINEKNEVKAANGKDFFQFGFVGCIVTVRIETLGESCMLTLTQEEIQFAEQPSENLYVQCGFGWTFYLANLKSILEGGIDLRNKDMDIKNVLNA